MFSSFFSKHDKELHECPECGLHYRDVEQARKCEEWCREHHSCNLEITKGAVEHEKHEQT